MNTTSLESLDALLIKSDPDGSDWNDGGEWEFGWELLSRFSEAEWRSLEKLRFDRTASWKTCLASILVPKHAQAAEQLLLALAEEDDGDVAFEALHQIAFYCGINDGPQGPFVDVSIRVPLFLGAARNSPGLQASIVRFIDLNSSKLELLLKVLKSDDKID